LLLAIRFEKVREVVDVGRGISVSYRQGTTIKVKSLASSVQFLIRVKVRKIELSAVVLTKLL